MYLYKLFIKIKRTHMQCNSYITPFAYKYEVPSTYHIEYFSKPNSIYIFSVFACIKHILDWKMRISIAATRMRRVEIYLKKKLKQTHTHPFTLHYILSILLIIIIIIAHTLARCCCMVR